MRKWKSARDIDWLCGFAYGILLLAIFIFFFAMTAAYENKINIFELENIFFGLIAISAAFASIRAIRVQVIQEIEREERRNRRRLLMLRATLPLEVSEAYREINKILAWHNNPLQQANFNIEALERALKSIAKTIEYADEESGKNIACFTSIFQILKSRLEEHTQKYSGRNDATTISQQIIMTNHHAIVSEFINWAAYRSILSQVFGYARRETECLNPLVVSRQDIEYVIDFYYLEMAGPEEFSQQSTEAKALIKGRIDNGKLLGDFWEKSGVKIIF